MGSLQEVGEEGVGTVILTRWQEMQEIGKHFAAVQNILQCKRSKTFIYIFS